MSESPDSGEQSPAALSPQEATISLLVSDGFSDKHIEDELLIAHSTLRTHINRIREKLRLRKDRSFRTQITRLVVLQRETFEQCRTKVRHDEAA